MALIPYTKWWEAKYDPSPNSGRTWQGTNWQDATFKMALSLGALKTTSPLGWYDANAILIDTAKLNGTTMATTTTNTTDTIKNAVNAAVDPLYKGFQDVTRQLLGLTATSAQTATAANLTATKASAGGMDSKTLLIVAAVVVVGFFFLRKK